MNSTVAKDYVIFNEATDLQMEPQLPCILQFVNEKEMPKYNF